jgi:hypothetical protein
MTRNGKIARLPKDIREQLNRRMENGWRLVKLVKWLNALPEVKEVLREEFHGRAIIEQNISQWRDGGYADWLRHQGTQEQIRWVAERSEDVDKVEGNEHLCERLARVAAAELAEHLQRLSAVEDPHERWKQFREICLELWRLRNGTHYGRGVDLSWDRWQREVDQEEAALEEVRQQEQAERRGSQEESLEWLMDLLHRPDIREWVRTDWPSREVEMRQLKEIYHLKPDSKDTPLHPSQHSRDALRQSAVYNYPNEANPTPANTG